MTTIDITIQGKTALLVHAFTDEAQLQASAGSRTSSMAADRGTPQETAAKHLYRSADGEELVMPQPNIFSCLVEAGKFFKVGRNKITTTKSSLLPAVMEFDEIEYPLISEGGWTVDTRAVRIPATGGRIQRHRPRFDDWQIEFSVELDTNEINVSLFRDIVDAAGRKVGLGDFRPACKGPYGRFVVTKWEERKD